MKVLLVRLPSPPETIGLQHLMVVEPLELEVLGAQVRPPDEALLVDLVLEREPLDVILRRERPEVVCVTGYITHVGLMKDACRLTRRLLPATRTVVGGVHCEVCPDDLDDPAVDLRVVRNGATVFAAILDHLRGTASLPPGVLRAGERVAAADLPPFDFRFPLPDRALTSRYRHAYFYVFHDRVALLKTSFGCPYHCRFCFCREITGHAYAERPMENVLVELQSIREREVYIVDDDFLVDPARVGAFADANQRLRLDKRYLLYGRADFIARCPAQMADLRAAGLDTVIVGLESFSDEDLRRYDKGLDAATNREAMRVLRQLGVECYATVIIPPHWDLGDFERCRETLVELGIRYVNLQPLTPLPGTAVSADAGEVLLDRRDWPRWDLAHVALRPTRLGVADFYGAILRLYEQILFQPTVLANHLARHRLTQLWKIGRGSARVHRQYRALIRSAQAQDA